MSIDEKAVFLHKQWNGKIKTCAKAPVKSREDLAIAYTPGVAAPCRIIAEDKEAVYTYTLKANTVAVVSDGSAVLGLGNIGPEAAMPVMEGKCVLFKEFGDINAFPICLSTQDPDEIVAAVKAIAPTFGGINLEDISAPRCFEIEERLKKELNIPVFHDDQHGTAIVVSSALINALKIVKKDHPTIVINGAGSAGCAIAKLILKMKLGNVILCDIQGILNKEDKLTSGQRDLIDSLNEENRKGTLKDAMKNADVFIGVSAGHIVSKEMIQSMNDKPIVFAMANPVPEIEPELAKEGGAYIIGTGRSDHPNQINNVLAFPGIFKGALQVQATCINDAMKQAAVYAIASLIPEEELNPENIIVSPLKEGVADVVSKAVAQAAVETGVIRKW